MSQLAINGGKKIRETGWPVWPIIGDCETEKILEVVKSGVWSYNGPQEKKFSQEFAEYIGTEHAICVANGTVSLQIALEALGIGYGDEVIVPGLTWQATAAVCVDVNAVPILVDVEEESWCIDPQKVEEAISERTKAIIVVHLYGSNPKMDEIMALVKKHNLYLIEDCAHQHGTILNGKRVGSLGDVGSFSFQQSKVLTSGEGGAVTTNSRELAEKMDALRNCGRKPVRLNSEAPPEGQEEVSHGFYVEEGNFIHSGNYRITEFQAAMLSCQLSRLDEQLKKRDQNAIYLNQRFQEIEGITPMRREPGVELQSYFNFVFRYDKNGFHGLDVKKFRATLSAELGTEIEACYEPLNNCQLYKPLTKNRYKLSQEYIEQINPERFSLPVCENAYHNESMALHHSILLAEKSDMDDIVNAILKIQEHVDEL